MNSANKIELDSIRIEKEPKWAPFPQANDLSRVLEMVELVVKSPRSISELARHFKITTRQASYYIDAARYLELVQAQDGAYASTVYARNFIGACDRNAFILERLARYPTFRKLLEQYFESETLPNIRDAENVLTEELPSIKSKVTRERRASTAVAWIKFLTEGGRDDD